MHTGLEIVQGAYFQDLLEQPAAASRTITKLLAAAPLAQDLSCLIRDLSPQRIVLTGMGSSFHALHPLRIRLTSAGHHVSHIETSELLHADRPLLTSRTLTIAVSQSGESAEVVRLLQDKVAQGPVIGVTNTPGSTLATASQFAVVTDAGPEATVSCKSYIAGLLALDWLGSALLHEAPQASALLATQAALASYLQNWPAHTDALLESCENIRQVFVIGRGCSLATAGTGGLILKESVRLSAEGMSSAAFRHGPLEMTSPSVLVCICRGHGAAVPLHERLEQDIRRAGGRVLWLESGNPTEIPEPLAPILEILPVQMLSLSLAALRGEEAGRFRHASKITTLE